ncbi:hypothetical protein EIK76_02290 [Rheinheimera mesophila]|uniref:DUF3375 domain-containing protein n=1 Tax=Rheinheimera mesophila TaxID=1547515 RepID=A0A3P3QNX1_9GAMM|nr:hypothetical protein [Rheinheimera mesophila]KKL02834.1 hypothetical protein SD53_03080 [Rheinheimera mesophila]RRJ22936.1 hypothetical protein EIK76_02290 [Rheinheimera mesophila]
MIAPRKIIRCLDEHWTVIEQLVERSSSGNFSFQDVQHLILRHNSGMSSEQVFREAQRFLQLEILIPLAKSSQLELNRSVLEFAQQLMQEQQLGLATDIESRILELKRLSERMQQAAQNRDSSELRRFSRVMDERIREVLKHFGQNESAILSLVERAKADEGKLSLARRYAAVMDAFDDYIDPVLALVDINGPFQLTVSAVETMLSDLLQLIEVTGTLNTEKETLIQLRTRLIEMNQVGRESLSRCADLLMPLRDELRRNTLLSRNASFLLGQMRKKGIDLTLEPLVPAISSDSQRFSLGSANQITSYMAELCHYEHDAYQLPEEILSNHSMLMQVPELKDVVHKAKTLKKLPDLSRWLADSYPELPVDELLFLYQELSRSDELSLEHSKHHTELTLNGYKLTLHPFQSSDAGTL